MIRDHFHVSFSGLGRAKPRLVTLNAQTDRMPPGLEGVRLLFATDIHMSGGYPERAVLRLINQMQELAPDLILWGGDFAESTAFLRRFFSLAARLRPPMGMFAVPGNNDVEQMDKGGLRALMAESGVTLLINECASLRVEGGSLLILGLDEPKHGHPVPSILSRRGEPVEYRILLVHSPLALQWLPDSMPAPPDLILCGHTHGGQLSAFGFSAYSLGYEQARGKKNFHVTGTHRLGDATLVVSNGVGTTMLPLRIGAPPQLHMVHLSREI